MNTAAAVEALKDAHARIRMFHPGDTILSQGETSQTLYTMTSGWAAFHKNLPDGREGVTCFVLPGDVFGLSPVGAPTNQTTIAITAALVCPMSMPRHARLRGEYEALNERFIWQIERDSAIMFETFSHIAGSPAISRLAFVLWTLAVRTLGRRPRLDGEVVSLPLTQLHLAAATQLSPVHLNRTLRHLREDGILQFYDRRLTIFNESALEAIAGSSEDLVNLWSRGPSSPWRRGLYSGVASVSTG